MAVAGRTPLHEHHRRLGARMVPFAGWEMPLQYAGILEEHRAVRTAAGLFDVSHMGELRIGGPDALALVQRLITNDAAALAIDQALYTPICYPDGGTVDDCLVYRTGERRYLLVVNASRTAEDLAWARQAASGLSAASVEDVSLETALLALQGPRAAGVLGRLWPQGLTLPPFHSLEAAVAGVPCRVSRTGYTGEDGFELFCAWDRAPALWEALLRAGQDVGLQPAGLGARDTLRLEAALPLYGHELSPAICPLEARLGRFVAWSKGDFIGREALEAVRQRGPARRLCGLVLEGRAVAREGHRVDLPPEPTGQTPEPARQTPLPAGQTPLPAGSGVVTSGTFSPTLARPVALALVDAAAASPGREATVAVRGRSEPARTVTLPFYRRAAQRRPGAAVGPVPVDGGPVPPTASPAGPQAGPATGL